MMKPVRLSRIVGLSLIAAALVILPWALPDRAGAATVLGQVSPVDPSVVSTGNLVQGQTATIPYTVLPPGGVITGWSHRGENGSAGSGRLQVWRQVGMTSEFFLVGRSDLETFTAGGVSFFSTRVPVVGGELLGLRAENAGGIHGSGSGTDVAAALSGGDPAPGETRNVTGAGGNTLVNVSAVLEADADDDDFGDETQDQCLGQAGTSNGCPPPGISPTAAPTGKRAAALKKCKKKFSGKAKAKKRKKCIKKAKKLPV
jgi:hypothetical protein